MPEPSLPYSSLPEAGEILLIRLENITKRFPGVTANTGIQLRIRTGAFHAVIGENGAGKSTLLHLLYGRYRPDEGRIFVRGEDVTGSLFSPADALRKGIGLVSQHNTLIPALTVLENAILGAEPTRPGGILDRRRAEEQLVALAARMGLSDIDWSVRAEQLSVAAGQKIEILKALYRGVDLLMLDEPTATLAPQEAETLFSLLHTLNQAGATILFVTHKLQEVMQHSDYVTVLRAGRNAGDFLTAQTNEQELLAGMIRAHGPSGEESLPRRIESARTASPLLQLAGVGLGGARGAPVVQDVWLEVRAGEIVGVAGVDGSGQRELAEAIVGLRSVRAGDIRIAGRSIIPLRVRRRQQQGLAYIPEDRHHAGLVLDFTLAENYLLGHEGERAWGGGVLLRTKMILARAAAMIAKYQVRVGRAGGKTPVRTLSGGNQQKIVVARAMESRPRLIVACRPTRGLDVEAARFVHSALRLACRQGAGVLLFSLDLDELLLLGDRIAVMFNGRNVGVLARGEANAEKIGVLMTGASGRAEAAPPPVAPSPSEEER